MAWVYSEGMTEPLDPRSYVYQNARRVADQVERDMFAEIEPPRTEPTVVGMVRRALLASDEAPREGDRT